MKPVYSKVSGQQVHPVSRAGVKHHQSKGRSMRPISPHILPLEDKSNDGNISIHFHDILLPAKDVHNSRILPFLEVIPQTLIPQTVFVEGQPAHLYTLDLQEETTLPVTLNEPPAPPGNQREKQSDYYANVGDAIRTLREDIPLMFVKDLDCTSCQNDHSNSSTAITTNKSHTSADSIYRDDIVFRDPNLSFKGIKNYKIIFWSLRFHSKLFFTRMHVEVQRIWQPEDHQIKMRWRVLGKPRVWWETEGVIDGISTYKLDREGMIYEHSVDNMQLRDPPITNPILYGLNIKFQQQLSSPQQVPLPGSWFTNHQDDTMTASPSSSSMAAVPSLHHVVGNGDGPHHQVSCLNIAGTLL